MNDEIAYAYEMAENELRGPIEARGFDFSAEVTPAGDLRLSAWRTVRGVKQVCSYSHELGHSELTWNQQVLGLSEQHPVNAILQHEGQQVVSEEGGLYEEDITNFANNLDEADQFLYEAELLAGSVSLFEAKFDSEIYRGDDGDLELWLTRMREVDPIFHRLLPEYLNSTEGVRLSIRLDYTSITCDLDSILMGGDGPGPKVGLVALEIYGEDGDAANQYASNHGQWYELSSRITNLVSEDPRKLFLACLAELPELEKRAPRLVLDFEIDNLKISRPTPGLAEVTGVLNRTGRFMSVIFVIKDDMIIGVDPSSRLDPTDKAGAALIPTMMAVVEGQLAPRRLENSLANSQPKATGKSRDDGR